MNRLLFLSLEMLRTCFFSVVATWLVLIPAFLTSSIRAAEPGGASGLAEAGSLAFMSLLYAGTAVYFMLPYVFIAGAALGCVSFALALAGKSAVASAKVGGLAGFVTGLAMSVATGSLLGESANGILGLSGPVLLLGSGMAGALGAGYLWVNTKAGFLADIRPAA